jgi:hypothetical protein
MVFIPVLGRRRQYSSPACWRNVFSDPATGWGLAVMMLGNASLKSVKSL